MTATPPSRYSGEIFDLWDTYHKVVVADVMAHRAIAHEIERDLRERFAGGGFAFLDLGCGDASVIAPILRRLAPAAYRGVDLSRAALDFAARNLGGLGCPVELAQADILSELARGVSADVIHCSFVLHHLATPEKADFFSRAAPLLREGGVLLLTDTVREDDESLSAYLDHYCGWIETDWGGLARDEKDAVYDHIRASDRPDTLATLDTLASRAGLRRLDGDGKHGWHRLMRYVAA